MYTKTLTPEQQSIMDAKALVMKQTMSELFDFILDKYVKDCRRDVEAELNSKLIETVSKMTLTEKQLLIQQYDVPSK